MNNRKKEYDPSKDMNKPQSGAQPEAAPLEKTTPPPSFREIYEQSPHLNSVIVPIGNVLGYGTHSDVYRGELTGSGQSVTIKVDRRPLRSTNKAYSQFGAVQKRVNWLKRFKHPGMAELIDWIPDWDNNRSYIIMRYIEGKGLNQALADGRAFSQAQVLNWTFQLLDVMEYLHGQRCVIGELETSNIVLTPDDKRVCLVDFKYLTAIEEGVRSKNKVGNQSFGLYEGGEALAEGIREDIRHLGWTLFELLTGTKPEKLTLEGTPAEPSADAPRETLYQKLSERGVSDSVTDVILRAMSTEPDEGFRSAADMRQALQELPVKDNQASFHALALAGGVLLTIVMLAIGAFSIWKGLYQSNRYAEMTISAGNSAKALERGAYSEAFDLADSATQRKNDNDPPCPPEAQAALAAAMSVYDYVRSYKPFSNFKLNGTPVQAHFSPDGSRIAVLVKTGYVPPRNEIQILETQSGKPLVSLPASDSSASDFLFFDNDTLFYAGKKKASGEEKVTGEVKVLCYSVSEERYIFEGFPQSSGESRPVSVALSDDRKVAASLFQGDSTAYLYDVDAILSGGQGELVRPMEIRDASTGNTVSDSLNLASSMSQMSNFLALNANGEYLALNFPDGGVGLYYLPDGQEPVYYELLDKSDYIRFEGGFFQDYFFYAASTSEDLSALVPFQGALFSLGANGPELKLRRNRTLPIHIQANETGIYLSEGSCLYYADTDALNFQFLADAENSIRLLHHAAGRLLAVTDKGLVLVYREDGAWKVETAQGPFDIAGLSKRYAFLASGKERALSVLEWKAQGVTALTYNPGEEELQDYKQHYEHVGSHVSADGQTAMLFRSAGFRIYRLSDEERIDPGADAEETKFDDLAQTLIYQRVPRLSDDPEEECLKVIGAKQVSFYSAKTGAPLYSRDVRADDDIPVFITRSYRVQQKSDGEPVKIFRGKSDKQLLTELNEGTLTHASQQGDCLIVCFRTGDNLQRSLLLDKNLDVIAELPEPCEALPEGAVLPTPSDSGTPDATNDAFPYGTLVFDDMQGHLLQGPLYTLEGLRALAIDRKSVV